MCATLTSRFWLLLDSLCSKTFRLSSVSVTVRYPHNPLPRPLHLPRQHFMFYDHRKLHFVWFINIMSWMKLFPHIGNLCSYMGEHKWYCPWVLLTPSPWMTLLVSRALSSAVYQLVPHAHWFCCLFSVQSRLRPVSQVFQVLLPWDFVKNLHGAFPRRVRAVFGHLLT